MGAGQFFRTLARLGEMTLPFGGVFFFHSSLLLYRGVEYFALTQDVRPCDGEAILAIVVLFLAVVGSFAWGLFQVPSSSLLREGCSSGLLMLAYGLAVEPSMWMCFGMPGAVMQAAFWVFSGVLCVTLVLVVVLSCLTLRRPKFEERRVDSSSSAELAHLTNQ